MRSERLKRGKLLDFQARRKELVDKKFLDRLADETAKRVITNIQRAAIERIAAVEYPVFTYIIGTTSVMVLPANPDRQYLLVQNTSASNVYLAINRNATAQDITLYNNGGYFEPLRPPKGAIYLLGSAASLNCAICEG